MMYKGEGKSHQKPTDFLNFYMSKKVEGVQIKVNIKVWRNGGK